MSANAVTADRPFSLLGAALLWSGTTDDLDRLREPCLVIKARPPTRVEPESDAGFDDNPSDDR
jgi:hypothetical protein